MPRTFETGFRRWQGWMKMMSKPQRLHPAAIIFNFIRILKEGIYAIIIGFITFRGLSFVYFISALAAVLILLISISILIWYRFTYQIEADELRIQYGIFVKKRRFISKHRIQSIDLTAGVIHRIFKLVKVEIDTASGSGAEASLKAVTLTEGERVRSELKKTRVEEVESGVEAKQPPRPSFTVSFKRLFLAGSTSGSVGIILAFFFFGFSQLEQFIPESYYENTLTWIIGLSLTLIIGLGIIVLVLLWLFGIAGTMIKYGHFMITKNEDELFITRGLLEKKQSTIPLGRIQAVGIQESIIRQPLGYVTVFAEVAGGMAGKGEDFSTMLHPMLKKTEVQAFLNEMLPEYAVGPDEISVKLPGRAQKYYMIRALLPIVLPLIAVLYFIPRFFWIPVIVMVLCGLLGYLRYRAGGYHIAGNCLIIRYRTFNKITMIMYHKRVQAFESMQHFIHRRERLATVKLSIIGVSGSGKHYTLKELTASDANHLSDWYSYRK